MNEESKCEVTVLVYDCICGNAPLVDADLFNLLNDKEVELTVVGQYDDNSASDIQIFERLRKNRPNDLEKLKIIEGDQMELGMGISLDDRQLLKMQISVVIHAAASVRFDDFLSKAILCNTRGTREMLHLATEMEKLKVFVYVSTAYSNAERIYIEEKLYDPPANWRTMISAAENLDPFQLEFLTKKLIGRKPNSYVFSKALAEAVVNNYKDHIPAIIVRPSIVVAAHEEPIPGYNDNFNGPVGLMTAYLTGIALVGLVDPEVAEDVIPADVTTKGIIIAAWKRTQMPFIKIQRKFFIAILTLKFFTHTECIFSTPAFNQLEKSLHPPDKEHFEFNLVQADVYSFMRNKVKGIRTFLLKETTTLEQNAKLLKILYYVHIFLCLAGGWLLYWFCSSYSIPQRLMSLVFFVCRKIFFI
ncbi:putative fatty acyl-CoA reductase CG5065 [Anabrus simplex]|uniref:putative fatty acyl-CoA reductase CG5065 n=1 Tax=Anabrus simplex TaxID=316456 RepID=UPI0035A2B7DB